MSRRHHLPLVGLVAIAFVTALTVVGVATLGGENDSDVVAPLRGDIDPGTQRLPDSGLPEEGIEARGFIEPRIILFGDTIRARVDVLLDRRKVDPSSVRVSTEFLPWELVRPQTRTRSDSGSSTHLRAIFTLRCTSSPCLPTNEASALEFSSARVSYTSRQAAPGERRSLEIDWPLLLVYSRFAAANSEGPVPSSVVPWRADLESFPVASYRISPALLVPALLVLAAIAAVGAVALAFIAVPRRRPEPEPEPEPEPDPIPLLTPLEQALELLEDASRADGAEDRRRALELVAEMLDAEHPELARAARTLAWSEDDPRVEQTSGLATRVRTTIDLTASGNGNGRVH